MRTCCTRSKSLTVMALALPPLTETVAVQPESQATERVKVDGEGACSLMSSDFVVLETICTGSRRPFPVEATTGSAGLRSVKTAYPCDKPAHRPGPGARAE